MKPRYHFFLIVVAFAFVISGCLYRPDIQQGNELTDEMIASITVGMTKEEVADILGEPLVTDPFNRDRWDYYYFLRDGKSGTVIRRTLFIEFIDEKISHFEGSTPTSKTDPAPETASTDS